MLDPRPPLTSGGGVADGRTPDPKRSSDRASARESRSFRLAVWKATLVAMYYMHLKFERLRLVLLASAPLPLAIILVLAVLLEHA